MPAGTTQEFTNLGLVFNTHFDTSPGQGLDNKDPGSQIGLLPHVQGSDEAMQLNKYCQHGTATGKITLLPPTVLAQGELLDSS